MSCEAEAEAEKRLLEAEPGFRSGRERQVKSVLRSVMLAGRSMSVGERVRWIAC